MLFYIGFDDTDTAELDRGTGRLARMFEDRLPENARLVGVVRQQLPVIDGIPYTSHNSSACVIVEAKSPDMRDTLIERAIEHIAEHFVEGSDPGLCVVGEGHPVIPAVVAFGRTCCRRIVTQKEALHAVQGAHCSGHGGTNDGIIGAVAGVGLTVHGWCGRYIEFGRLRDFPESVPVGDLEGAGISVMAVGRDAMAPSADDLVHTGGWLRPGRFAYRPVVMVHAGADGSWEIFGGKMKKRADSG